MKAYSGHFASGNHTSSSRRLINYLLPVACLFFCFMANGQVINRAEYFIDMDPGNGNAVPVTSFTPASLVNFNFNVPTNSLSLGFHILGFRIRETVTGRWSQTHFNSFYIVPPVSFPVAVNLVAGEYFFDTDPGFGNGISFPFSPSGSVSVPLNTVSIGSLVPGFHTITFRFRDNLGKWTHGHAQSFYVIPPVTNDPASSIVAAEYFFNTDLGAGNNTSLPISPGNPQANHAPIPLPGALTSGFHQIGFRYRDNKGRWSHADIRTFYIVPSPVMASRQIVAARYFLDDDLGNGTPIAITGITPGVNIDEVFLLDMTGVPTGPHTISIQIKDSEGFWSYLETKPFSISSCVPPPSPSAQTGSRCNEGNVTLTATGATGTQVYRWYDDPILSNVLFTGTPFTSPELTATKTYYVSVYDPGTDCESSRVAVQAIVNIIPKPVINPSGSLSICEGSFVFLSAPAGYNQYVWSNGQTTQQILATTGGNYTVQIGDGTCLSEPSEPVTLTVVLSPEKPSITITGNPTICGTGSVDLTGPAGFEYLWSSGSTSRTITVTQTGVYFLVVRVPGANCPSLPSDPVVVSVLTPPCGSTGPANQPPVINSKPFASQIEGKVEVDLSQVVSDPDNNVDFSSLRVINNSTSRGAPAIIDAAYFLQIDYTGNPFTGTDRVTLEVCDLGGLCVQQVIDIDVVGAVVVFNGLTPDGDGYNDFMLIKYVDVVEGASQNNVTIFNRWGDVVFDIQDYNNTDRVFAGKSNSGSDLPSGTYFYKIEFTNGAKPLSGYLTLIR